jgi:hypothetical protein
MKFVGQVPYPKLRAIDLKHLVKPFLGRHVSSLLRCDRILT